MDQTITVEWTVQTGERYSWSKHPTKAHRYHESGHAIAAVIREGFVTSMDFSFEVETSRT
jgi:hypothetical protein